MLTLEGLASSRYISYGNLLIINNEDELNNITEPVIIAAKSLTPSLLSKLDKSNTLALLSRDSSYINQASIFAKSISIPAVLALNDCFDNLKNGQFVIVDGICGCVVCEPDFLTFGQYKEKISSISKEQKRLFKLSGTPSVTSDGFHVNIYASIDKPYEINTYIADCDGLGLLRSEFLYMESTHYPSEEMSFHEYKKILQAMYPKKVTIMTLNLGAEMQMPYFNISSEQNPALGYRAIRVSLDRTEIFIKQLRALLRASIFGNLAIVFPMITTLEEVNSIYKIIDNLKLDLNAEGIPFSDDIEFGVIIETPSAALVSDSIAKIVDFVQIATHNLAKYTLAVDPLNAKINYLFDLKHTAVLRLIKLISENAHKNGIKVILCEECSLNAELIEYYIAMGIDSFSVSPSNILKLKEIIQNLSKKNSISLLNELNL